MSWSEFVTVKHSSKLEFSSGVGFQVTLAVTPMGEAGARLGGTYANLKTQGTHKGT